MQQQSAISVLLADDDDDDCFIFREVLKEIAITTRLFTVSDGIELMNFLAINQLPEVLFLDLNMPKKNGIECLTEIKCRMELQNLAVVIFSTSFDEDTLNQLYKNGASYHIRKPADFEELKQVIGNTLELVQSNSLLKIKKFN